MTITPGGLVTILPGRGTFVAELNPTLVSDQLGRYFKLGRSSLQDLNEARHALEVEMAGLAALRATPEDLVEIRQALETMERHFDSPDAYIEADLTFHAAVAEATQNEIFSLLVSAITDLLQESRRLIYQVPGAPKRGQSWHRLIYQAIQQGDAEAAGAYMREHMRKINQDAETARENLQQHASQTN